MYWVLSCNGEEEPLPGVAGGQVHDTLAPWYDMIWRSKDWY